MNAAVKMKWGDCYIYVRRHFVAGRSIGVDMGMMELWPAAAIPPAMYDMFTPHPAECPKLYTYVPCGAASMAMLPDDCRRDDMGACLGPGWDEGWCMPTTGANEFYCDGRKVDESFVEAHFVSREVML